MANGRFTPAGQPADVFDHGKAASEREQAERQAFLARQERCERWIAARMAGRTFESREALEAAARGLVVTLYGRPLTEDERHLIQRACVALFFGLVDARYFAGRILVQRGERIRFLGAA